MKKGFLVLETDDGSSKYEDAPERQGRGMVDEPPAFESRFEKERPPSPTIKVNLKCFPGLLSLDDTKPFGREELYGAVVSGDPKRLEGLGDYLRKTGKYLTHSDYTDGKTGKTCLMKALLNLQGGTNPTIPELLKIDRETENPNPLVNVACKDDYYKGHTALHIAIEKRNLDLVKLLVENGASVHAEATGKFFQHREKEPCFYFGELPLSLAACTNQLEMIRYLLHNPHQKASLTKEDSLGNNVLHALVMVANDTEKNTEVVIKVYDEILKEADRISPAMELETSTNKQGLTPLTLAVKTGKVEIFKHILRRDHPVRRFSRKFTEWTYGPVQVSLYDLSGIDSYEANSVLEILAYSTGTPNRYKMVVLEPINKLLQHKWESFAARRFCISFLSYMLFMVVFSAIAYHRPLEGKPPFPVTLAAWDILMVIGQIFVVMGGIYLLIAQSLYLWRRRLSLKCLMADGCIELFLLAQAVTLLLSVPLYLAGREEYVPVMVFSLLLGWVNTLYYSRGFQRIGIYIVMIHKAILRDLLHFLLVYVVFLFGFATALVTLAGEVPQPPKNGSASSGNDGEVKVTYGSLFETSMELFKFTIGMGDLEFQEDLKFRYFVILLLLLFVILTYILLLNMLIALMSETVTNVSKYSESVWKLQRAITIMEIEKNWFWFGRTPQRCGIYLPIDSTKKDQRWFFRVEELDWADWGKEAKVLKEDPLDATDAGMEPQAGSPDQELPDAASNAKEEEVPLQAIGT